MHDDENVFFAYEEEEIENDVAISNAPPSLKKHSKMHTIKERKKHIQRKVRILKDMFGRNNFSRWYGEVPKGKFSKGKIHCSCYLCKPHKYDKSETVSNKRKIESAEQDIEEYFTR